MLHNSVENRNDFLGHLASVEGLRTARVVRADSVSKQFGKGLKIEQFSDAIDARVMRDGRPHYELMEEDEGLVFRGTLP